jgi:predicted MFS family arabinose efflux permease
MGIYAIALAAVVVILSQLLVNPPAAQKSAAPAPVAANKPGASGGLLQSPRFWLLWIIFFIGSGAGLMVISSINGFAKKSMAGYSFLAVAVLAVGNASGRILAGFVSDKIGRRATLMIVCLFQAALMFMAIPVTGSGVGGAVVIVLMAALMGANYGANLSLFPSITRDTWGAPSFGMNYGLVFTAWGVGGFALTKLHEYLQNNTHSFITAGSLLIVGALLTLGVRTERKPVA